MRVSTLGQLREAGRIRNMYSRTSSRPHAFKSEQTLIDEGQAEELVPTWGNMDWPDFVPPPPVPSYANERMDVKVGMRRRVWPHAGPWNLNVDPLEGIDPAKNELVSLALGGALIASSLFVKKETAKKLLRNIGYVLVGLSVYDVLKKV